METSNADRIIVLVDMDCFYVQVEQKLCPEYYNKPCAVVQYKAWKGGGIIAVNYEARAKGITRFLRGDEAQQKCPDIHLFRVPEVRGKADLTRYREAGALVLDVLCEYSDFVERASIDEAYLDMTSIINSKMQNTSPVTPDQLPNTFVIGWEHEDPESRKRELQKWLQMIYEEEHLYNDRMLAVAAVIVEEMRAAVYEKTGYKCSAGIAHNKMLAKLSCGIHKPNKQTVLPESSVQLLFKTMPINKVRNLGGKLGEAIAKKFNVENMGDLIDIPRSRFVSQFGEKTGHWLYNLVRGVENEPVISRQLPKSIGCGKNFPGKSALSTRNEVTHWLKQLATELEERLLKDEKSNGRFARLLTINIRSHDSSGYSTSRSCPIHLYNAEKLTYDALLAISKLNTSSSDTLWRPSIFTLSIVASKFEDKLDNSNCNIQSYLINTKSPGKKEGIGDEGERTSVSIESGNSSNAELVNSSLPKSAKCSGTSSNKSIVSFFTKKQIAETEAVDNIETAVVNKVENISGKAKDQNSSVYTIVDDSFCNDDVRENAKDVVENNTKPLGFFARKLAERSEFNFDVEFETACDNVNNLNNEQSSRDCDESALPEIIDILKPSTSSISGNVYSDLDPELTKLCEQCKKHIPIWEETEHLDYHMAVSLSREFLSKPAPNPKHSSSVSKTSIIGESTAISKSKRGGRGRKRGSVTKSSSHAKKSFIQKNTLDAFIK